jgi:hypothetical protein
VPCVIFTFGLDGVSHSLCWVAIRRSGGPVARGGSASVRVVGESYREGGCPRTLFRPIVLRWLGLRNDNPLLQPLAPVGISA